MKKTPEVKPTEADRIAAEIEGLKLSIAPFLLKLEELNAALIDLLPEPKDGEGSTTFNESYYKIETKHGFRRTPDQEKIQALFHPDNKKELRTIALIFPQAYKLDLKQYRACETMNKPLFKKVAAAVTTKPSKPSVKVTRLELDD